MVTVEYTDVHRALVQTIMGMGIVDLSAAQGIFARIIEKYGGDSDIHPDSLAKAVALVNKHIACFDQAIVLYEFPLDNKSYYIYYNTATTSTDKLQTNYSENELLYFQIILGEIADSRGGFCLPTQVLNMSNAMSKIHAQDLMEEWIKKGYFFKDTSTKDCKIHLGPKMLVEFKHHLINCFPNTIIQCDLCKEIVFSGSQCSSCKVMFHKKCIVKFHAGSKTCPGCKEHWASE